MNGHVCCILGVCCDPGSPAQIEALAVELAKGCDTDIVVARAHATWILKHLDLAPAGSLAQFKLAIATHAKKHALASRG